MKLKDIQIHGKTEWLNATYIDATGEEFHVVFTRSVDENSSHELRELTTVEQAENSLSCEHPIWNEIEKLVVEAEWEETIDYRNVHFVIKIDRNWLDVLQELTDQVIANNSVTSPEEALEFEIFNQIKQHLEE